MAISVTEFLKREAQDTLRQGPDPNQCACGKPLGDDPCDDPRRYQVTRVIADKQNPPPVVTAPD